MKNTLAVLIAVIITGHAISQNRISDHNTIGWYGAFITKKFNAKLSGHLEYQWRRDHLITDWQQSLFRTGINIKLHPQLTAQIGYAWIETFPYGDYTLASVPKTFPEHRIYEQLTATSAIGKVTLNNRLRVEQRWIGRYSNASLDKPDQTVYLNRLRYMLKPETSFHKNWYAGFFDEILIGFGKNVGENVFDQNRFSAYVGYKFSSQIKTEIGYVNQIVQLGREVNNKNVFQYNNGLLLYTYFSF